MAKILFLQGLVAWLSVCFLLTVVWHRRLKDDASAHEFSLASTPKSPPLAPVLGHLHPPTDLAERLPQPVPQWPPEESEPPRSISLGPRGGQPHTPLSPPNRRESEPSKRFGARADSKPPKFKRGDHASQSEKGRRESIPNRAALPPHHAQPSAAGGVRVEEPAALESHPSVEWLPDEALARTVDESPVAVYMVGIKLDAAENAALACCAPATNLAFCTTPVCAPLKDKLDVIENQVVSYATGRSFSMTGFQDGVSSKLGFLNAKSDYAGSALQEIFTNSWKDDGSGECSYF